MDQIIVQFDKETAALIHSTLTIFLHNEFFASCNYPATMDHIVFFHIMDHVIV